MKFQIEIKIYQFNFVHSENAFIIFSLPSGVQSLVNVDKELTRPVASDWWQIFYLFIFFFVALLRWERPVAGT